MRCGLPVFVPQVAAIQKEMTSIANDSVFNAYLDDMVRGVARVRVCVCVCLCMCVHVCVCMCVHVLGKLPHAT